MTLTRAAPKRTITKLDAIRHLLHASIRMHFAKEDPFAIHLLIQSTEKLIGDFAKGARIPGYTHWDALLIPERSKEFFVFYRETYNYFKHADRDWNERLSVYNPIVTNELSLFLNVTSARDIGIPFSEHMHL